MLYSVDNVVKIYYIIYFIFLFGVDIVIDEIMINFINNIFYWYKGCWLGNKFKNFIFIYKIFILFIIIFLYEKKNKVS